MNTEPSSRLRLSADDSHVLTFRSPSLDLVFDDEVFDSVKEAWRLIMGSEANNNEFMVFPDREVGVGGDDDE
jgi:Rab proteins geranylgeranyltransferase component A